jgi:hypothetical protein
VAALDSSSRRPAYQERRTGLLASAHEFQNDEGVKVGLFIDKDTTRQAGLRLRRLQEALKQAKVQDALVAELEVAGATGKDKLPAIERRIEELRASKSSLWFEVPVPEVLAASIFKAKALAGAVVDDLWKRVARIQDLAAPLASWLDLAGLIPRAGGTPATGRANVIGYRGGSFVSDPRVVAIEVLNDVTELGRALDDMRTSKQHTSASYLACTPALVAEFLWSRTAIAPHWDPDALDGKLRAAGFGLLLIEGDAVAQAVLPQERKADNVKLGEIASSVTSNDKARP